MRFRVLIRSFGSLLRFGWKLNYNIRSITQSYC
jgi:hypothetical protein